MWRRWSSFLLMLLVIGVGASVAVAQGPQVRLRAAIEKVEGRELTLRTREGEVAIVRLEPDAAVSAVVPVDLAAIKEGSFVGVAATARPGRPLEALEVLVFPDALRGTGEGHYPWDLTPESTMTNATVEAAVRGIEGRVLELTYKGGRQTIIVPPEAPIVTLEPADTSLLQPGAHVFLSARKQGDGTFTAARIAVGKDGLVPPM